MELEHRLESPRGAEGEHAPHTVGMCYDWGAHGEPVGEAVYGTFFTVHDFSPRCHSVESRSEASETPSIAIAAACRGEEEPGDWLEKSLVVVEKSSQWRTGVNLVQQYIGIGTINNPTLGDHCLTLNP